MSPVPRVLQVIVVERVFEVKGFAAARRICWNGYLERTLTCSLSSRGWR